MDASSRMSSLESSLPSGPSASALPILQGPLSLRYPDPAVEVLDPAFLALRLFSSSVEQLATGMRWAEGPVWFGDGRYLLVSDIPNNRILRWDECSGAVSVFRQPSNHANGHTRDLQGRLVSCEHLTRRITRTEFDGAITVLADRFEGRRLNSPNDIVCARDGALWFTDPPFGIHGFWEGEPAEPELPFQGVFRLDPATGRLQAMLRDLAGPNGLAFSPDGSVLYVVESRAKPHRLIWGYDVGPDGALSNKRLVVDAQGPGRWTALRSMSRATCGAVGAVMVRWEQTRPPWTGCASSPPQAKPSPIFTCRSAVPTCALVGGTATACSWPPATACMRCM